MQKRVVVVGVSLLNHRPAVGSSFAFVWMHVPSACQAIEPHAQAGTNSFVIVDCTYVFKVDLQLGS